MELLTIKYTCIVTPALNEISVTITNYDNYHYNYNHLLLALHHT